MATMMRSRGLFGNMPAVERGLNRGLTLRQFPGAQPLALMNGPQKWNSLRHRQRAFSASGLPWPPRLMLSGSLNLRYSPLAAQRYPTVMPRRFCDCWHWTT